MYQSRTPHLLSLLMLIQTAAAAFGTVDVEHVAFGFNDGYKIGKWAPVDITVRSHNEPFIGELVIEVRNFFSDAHIQRYATPLKLGATERQSRRFYVYCPNIATKLIILAVPVLRGRSTASRTMTEISPPTPIALKDYFVLALAPSGDKLNQFLDKKEIGADAQAHVRYLPNARALPTQWIGYDAVDILIIREVALTERNVTKAQQTALLDWVQRGGTLIVSGGSNFRYLRGSFIEPFLPVQLMGVETVEPTRRRELPAAMPPGKHERIIFKPKASCSVVLGTDEDIVIAKRHFGSGQILCLAFDYDILFTVRNLARDNPSLYGTQLKQGAVETFWRRLLETHGKSPRHLAHRYAPHRRHEEKIDAQFLKKMPTQVPLIKRLAIALPVYLFSFGAVLFIFKRRAPRPRMARARPAPSHLSGNYWIGGVIVVLVSVSAIGVARTGWFPNSIAADRIGILSIYPERQRAHLQRYVALRATAREETSFRTPQGTFIRPLEPIEREGGGLGTAIQASPFQMRSAFVEPWHPRTYVEEVFFSWDKAWQFDGEPVTVDGTLKKVPPDEGLNGTRKAFAQILQREGVLQYLLHSENATQIGWTSQPITRATDFQQVTDETLLILYLNKGDNVAR